jgi:hypothetical protein
MGSEGQYLLAASDGEPLSFPAEDVALVETANGIELKGEAYPVLVAWLRRLNEDHLTLLDSQSKAYLKKLFIGEVQRLIDEAVSVGMPESRLQELRGRIAGKIETTAGNAPRQLKKLRSTEEGEREKLVGAYLRAARWCASEDLRQVAAALLSHAQELWPCEEAVELAAEWLPAEYPFVVNNDSPQQWIRWSRELLPAGARFIPRDDPAWKAVAGTTWAKNVIGLRTKNIELLTHSQDPEVLGACLRSGEAALRTLEKLVGREDSERSRERLQVRIHADREAYLSEHTPSPFDRSWTAGYYSPSERVSRFYVPTSRRGADATNRKLHKTFAHELTHQYLSQCWLPTKGTASGSTTTPGYWVVEGFARFIEEQVVELGRLGNDLQDETAMALDVSSGLQAREGLLPTGALIKMSHGDFDMLPNEAIGELSLRHALLELQITPKTIFYSQAGAVTYFMMHERGDEGREALLKFMRLYYTTPSRDPVWETLGFESEEQLVKGFERFLERLAG